MAIDPHTAKLIAQAVISQITKVFLALEMMEQLQIVLTIH